jgi:hypothetical protein
MSTEFERKLDWIDAFAFTGDGLQDWHQRGVLKTHCERWLRQIAEIEGQPSMYGMLVMKTQGAYRGSHWTVTAEFFTNNQQRRLVCEAVQIPGLLHIFSPEQVRVVDNVRVVTHVVTDQG